MNWIPYYAVCALTWFIVWAFGFWYYRSRQQHVPLLKRLSWPRLISLLAALALVPVAYVCSHAGYQRLLATFFDQHSWLKPMADLYVPLQLLMLLKDGTLDWSFDPFLYPAALAAVVAVPFLIHRMVSSTRIRSPRFLGFMLVGLLAVACFAFMLGPL
jgi:hypothetical protein